MKIVTRSRCNNVIKVHAEINSIRDLEQYLKTFKQKSRKLNDFICFNDNDKPEVERIIKSNLEMSHSELRDIHLKNIFKYRTKNQVGYWTCRGWSESDAKKQIFDWQSKLGKSTAKTRFSNPKYKEGLQTCIEYWLKKGYPLHLAQQKLKERQSTFTLKKCIKRHGKVEGTKRFNDRQKKWIDSLYKGKTEEEIIAFEKSKMVEFGKASKTSLEVFLPLLGWLNKENLISATDEYHLGYDNKQEFCLFNKEKDVIFFYDFTIPKMKIIIEFNGRIWHPTNENWKPLPCFDTDSKEEIVYKEKLKEQTAIDNGFRVLKIWDTDLPETNIQKCKDFILSTNERSG